MDTPVLSAEQMSKALEGIRTLDRMSQVFDDLAACGEDCQQRRQQAQDTRAKLEQLVNRFGRQP